jgi:hypothetical protein
MPLPTNIFHAPPTALDFFELADRVARLERELADLKAEDEVTCEDCLEAGDPVAALTSFGEDLVAADEWLGEAAAALRAEDYVRAAKATALAVAVAAVAELKR